MENIHNHPSIITDEPENGPGEGRHIVLISGDEEYRSEEVMPALARILSRYHGFRTTTLFAVDPVTEKIDPRCQTNIPGMERVSSADLIVLFTRFRELPDEQMAVFDTYLETGKPIVALRTATHAFKYTRHPQSAYAKYSFRSEIPGWEGGFGRRILGETWVDHHGKHGKEGTRALIDGISARNDHPILRGVEDIWTPTDVYGVRDLNGPADVLLWGASTSGMDPAAPIDIRKPLMPVAWTRSYLSEGGASGRAFATTMGCAQGFSGEDFRRLLVNACYWAVGLANKVPNKAEAALVGEYRPSPFGSR